MTLTISSIISAVKRHLSAIGKRLYSKDGKNMFAEVTLSSAEDTQLLTQYIYASFYDIEAALKHFITPDTSSPEIGKIKFSIQNTRAETDFEDRTKEMMEAYISLNAVAEYLAMVHPDIAQKYHADAQQRIQALAEYVFYKRQPVASTASYNDINGTSTIS